MIKNNIYLWYTKNYTWP